MDSRTALRWTAIYRGTAWLAGLLGLALAVLPLYVYGENGVGVDLFIEKVAAQPLLLAPVVLGFLVWQLGKTMAYYRTVTGAVDQQLGERFDPEMIKSDILSVLDDRLAEMQTEVEGTRRAVEEMDGGGTTGDAGFDFEE